MLNRKGVVLIIVLIIVAVVAAAVVEIELNSSNDYGVVEKLYENQQANLYFHSALNVAVRLLENDKNKYDYSGDDWNNLPPYRVNSTTTVSMRIFPLNGKININNIDSSDSKLKIRTQKAVASILLKNDLNPAIVMSELLGWMEGKKTRGFIKPIKGPFYSLKEIDMVEGLKDFAEKFHNYFTVGGVSGKININFADGDVMRAYLGEIAGCVDQIIAYRKKNPFKNITQLRNVSCVDDKDYLKIQPYITTMSYLFGVEIDVRINDNDYFASAVLYRDYSHNVRILKFFESKGYYE